MLTSQRTMENSIKVINVGHASDFVSYLEGFGLHSLIRDVLLYLVVPYSNGNIKDLTEAGNVSGAWRRAVDRLVHRTAIGRKCVADKLKLAFNRSIRALEATAPIAADVSVVFPNIVVACADLLKKIVKGKELLELLEHYANIAMLLRKLSWNPEAYKCAETMLTDSTCIIAALFSRPADNIMWWRESLDDARRLEGAIIAPWSAALKIALVEREIILEAGPMQRGD